MDALAELHRWSPLAGGAMAGLLPWAKFWLDSRSADKKRAGEEAKQRIDLVRLAEEVSAKAIARLQAQLDEIEKEFAEFRKRHDDMIEAKDAKIALLEQKLELKEGQVRQLQATVESYDRLLTKHDIDHIPPSGTVWQAKDGGMLLASGPLPETNLP